MLGRKYCNYEDALLRLNLYSLSKGRKQLCLNFAKSGLRNRTLTDLLQRRKSRHSMKVRKPEKHEVKFTNTERYGRSGIPYMQSLLNNDDSNY